jgi:rhodanese-related sulfurtransferase
MTAPAVDAFRRLPRRDVVSHLPQAVPGEPGRFTVDATWGTINPLELPGGVRTVGELEVIEHARSGGVLVDTRQPEDVAHGTIGGAVPIRHQEIVDGLQRLAPDGPVVLFCNGPQCAATPDAVAALLSAGRPAEHLRYYRGGIHDWVTLGLPLVDPRG